jgi:hypothetical protein
MQVATSTHDKSIFELPLWGTECVWFGEEASGMAEDDPIADVTKTGLVVAHNSDRFF